MVRIVTASEAKAKLSALVGSVAFGGQRVVIERRGKPLAALISARDLERLEPAPALSSHPGGALALVGAWKDVPEKDLDRLVADIYEAREKDAGRPVILEA